MMSIAKISELLARTAHSSIQTYDDQPYADGHLSKVVDVFKRFKHLIHEEHHDVVEAGCWLHDSIEDARLTYNDVKSKCGTQVAEIAYALTNEKGKNRKERANAKYYAGIRDTPHATFVKLCDRIANIENGLSGDGHMVEGYRKENTNFRSELDRGEYAEMFQHIENILAHEDIG